MHEFSLAKNILSIVNQSIKKDQHVKKIIIEIGELLAIDEMALQFSFDVLSKNMPTGGAQLIFHVIEGEGFCESCQKSVKINRYAMPCAHCGDFLITITRGEQLRVKSMEVV